MEISYDHKRIIGSVGYWIDHHRCGGAPFHCCRFYKTIFRIRKGKEMSNPESETQELAVYKKTQYLLRSDEALQRFSETMGNTQLAKTFVASVLLVVAENVSLQMCSPLSIMGAAMRAATLRLSVEPSQGHAYLVPYKQKCTFIIGYKGLIQLALRTNNYRDINVTAINEGETIVEDRLTGRHSFGMGGKTSDVEIGYVAYFQLRNGMTKTFYMTKAEAEAYGKRYSPSYKRDDSLWKTNFPAMAKKTVLKQLLSKWGDFNERDQAALKLALSTDEEIIEEEKWNVAIDDQKQIEDVKEAAEEAKFAAMSTDDLVSSLGFDVTPGKPQPIPDEQAATPTSGKAAAPAPAPVAVKIVDPPEPGSIFDIEPETLEGKLSNILNSIDQVNASINKHPTNEILIKRKDQLLMDKEKLEKEIAAAAK